MGEWRLCWWCVDGANGCALERPIRSFELLADVQASWNKDKMVNTFVIKLTPLAPILSRSVRIFRLRVRGKLTDRFHPEHSLQLTSVLWLCRVGDQAREVDEALLKAPRTQPVVVKAGECKLLMSLPVRKILIPRLRSRTRSFCARCPILMRTMSHGSTRLPSRLSSP